MENPLLCEDVTGDDVLRLCENVDALGNVVIALSEAERNCSDATLEQFGEAIGRMISDHGKAIRKVLNEAYPVLNDFLEAKMKRASAEREFRQRLRSHKDRKTKGSVSEDALKSKEKSEAH